MATMPLPPPPTATPHLATPPASGTWANAVATSLGIASMAGTFMGLLWGGIGGRVAMRVLFLTTGGQVRGVISDDGFEIGRISVAMVFLFVFTAILGGIAGAFYGLLRMATAGPTWLIAIGVAITSGACGGAALVQTDGIDFRLLEPVELAIALFVAIPAIWGLTVVFLAERLMRPGALFPDPPTQIGRRRFGAAGWLVLAALTIYGMLDLVSDIGDLT